jgi:hypothetical protein
MTRWDARVRHRHWEPGQPPDAGEGEQRPVGAEGEQRGDSVGGFPRSLAALQILDCTEDALPDGNSYDVASLTQFISTFGCPRRRVLAVVSDQELGRRPNVSDFDQAVLPTV